ncbi:MAG: hypothetical protein ACRCYX_15410 [Dermatophilaceae bacterium]
MPSGSGWSAVVDADPGAERPRYHPLGVISLGHPVGGGHQVGGERVARQHTYLAVE